MDTFLPSFVLHADRPLLGACALAACLAGGTATQNLAGLPHPVDTARFAPGWDRGAPAAPDQTIRFLSAQLAPRPLALSAAAHRAVSPSAPAERATGALVRAATRTALVARTSKARVLEQAPAAQPLAATAPLAETAIGPAALVLSPPAIEPAAISQAGLAAVVPPTQIPLSAAIQAPAVTPDEAAPLMLVNSPELRRFDLAKYKPVAPGPAKLVASRKASLSTSAKARTTDRLIDGVVYHQATILVAGQSGGEIAVRIGPDMKPSVKVADLLGLVSAQMDPDSLARFSTASSAGDYVSFAALRTAGFDVSYNAAADSIAISVSQ
jgi:hypothetical protein